MSSPPETDKEYAYFRAIGAGDTLGISEKLKIQPSECWNVGDPYERRGRNFHRRASIWKLDSGLNDNQQLEDHIETLLRRLTPNRNCLLELGSQFRLQIVCVSFVYQSFSFELPFELQRHATELGIGFWFDSYSYGDMHEEIVELREQLGVRGEAPTHQG